MSIIRSTVLRVVASAAVLAAAAPASWAADVGAGASLLSAFVWRGQVVNADAVLQPEISVSAGGLTFGLWGTIDLTDRNGTSGDLTEVDITVDYGFERGPVALDIGWIEYRYPDGGDSSRELFASGSLDVVSAPTLELYYDFGLVDGLYAVSSLGHEWSLAADEGKTLGLAFSAGWADAAYNRFFFEVDSAGWSDGGVALSLELSWRDSIAVTPSLRYSWFWDSTIREAARGLYGEADFLVAGITISASLP